MPVYQFICKKHGGFEKITIKAQWEDIRCPKCGGKSRVDKRSKAGIRKFLEKYLAAIQLQ